MSTVLRLIFRKTDDTRRSRLFAPFDSAFHTVERDKFAHRSEYTHTQKSRETVDWS
jgi:hypothetical protein